VCGSCSFQQRKPMELHDLGDGVLRNILSAVDPAEVHRFRLVCKKWKKFIDSFEHIRILLRFPSFMSQMGYLDLVYDDERVQSLWDALQSAKQQRYLYLHSQPDGNMLLLLERLFIEKIDCNIKLIKRMELLLDPNSK